MCQNRFSLLPFLLISSSSSLASLLPFCSVEHPPKPWRPITRHWAWTNQRRMLKSNLRTENVSRSTVSFHPRSLAILTHSLLMLRDADRLQPPRLLVPPPRRGRQYACKLIQTLPDRRMPRTKRSSSEYRKRIQFSAIPRNAGVMILSCLKRAYCTCAKRPRNAPRENELARAGWAVRSARRFLGM